MSSLLRRFASLGEQSLVLQHFVSSVLLSHEDSRVTTQTYQALAKALSSYFKVDAFCNAPIICTVNWGNAMQMMAMLPLGEWGCI